MSPKKTGAAGARGPRDTPRPTGRERAEKSGKPGGTGGARRGAPDGRPGPGAASWRSGHGAAAPRREPRDPGKSAPVRTTARPEPASRPAGGRERPAPDGAGLPWKREGRLFPAPGPEASAALTAYEGLLQAAMPLRISHARELPAAIHSLSASLTSERGAGPKPGYLSDPRMLAAYAWYFLPWNLYRLVRLLRGLALDLPDGATVVDAGAGPLTLVQALWIAAPHLRSRRLTFVCLDRSRAALALGRELFIALAGEDVPWRVEAVREELPRLPRGAAHLVTAINVVNELAARRSQSMAEKTALLAETLAGALVSGGRLLVVEPGIRASGKLLSRLREHLIEDEELSVLAPCTHAGPCPLAARGTGTWCHFTVDTAGVPDWLAALSKRAGLPKRDVSLSFLFAGDPGGRTPRADAALGRVVSNPFPVSGMEGSWARYACAPGGLRLYVTPSRGGLVPGDLARAERPEHAVRDKKSGAFIHRLAAKPLDGEPETGGGPGPKTGRPAPAGKGGAYPKQGAGDAKASPGTGRRPGKSATGGRSGPKGPPDGSRPKNAPDAKRPKKAPDAKGPKKSTDAKGPKKAPDGSRPKKAPDAKRPKTARPSGKSGDPREKPGRATSRKKGAPRDAS